MGVVQCPHACGLLCSEQLQLAGVVDERDQGPSVNAAEASAVRPIQPASALPHLPLPLSRGLQQLQPTALLECWLPSGYASPPTNKYLCLLERPRINRMPETYWEPAAYYSIAAFKFNRKMVQFFEDTTRFTGIINNKKGTFLFLF